MSESDTTNTTNTPSAPDHSAKITEHESLIEQLRQEISHIRQDHTKDKEDRDTLVGELQQRLDKAESEVERLTKGLEQAKKTPKQTMVPPPPPPQGDPAQPLPPNQTPTQAQKKKGWRGIW